MAKITRIDINHIDKIEGHAGFTGLLLDGKVKQAKIEVKQGVRLIETILQGRQSNADCYQHS